jgi:hypothetical protein
MAPRRPQKLNVLPAADREVPVPRTAILLLSDRDVNPVGFTPLNNSHELAEIAAGFIEIDNIPTVRQREQMIRSRCKNELSKTRTSASRRPIAILESGSGLATCSFR